MKRFTLIAVIAAFAFSVQGQVGVGLRGIWGIDGNSYGGLEFSVQKPNKWELDIGTYRDSWKVTGLKQFKLLKTHRMGLYVGGGLGYGYYEPIEQSFATFAGNIGSYIRFGRLQMGLDWRPEWNFFNAPGNDLSFNLALSARWLFGRLN